MNYYLPRSWNSSNYPHTIRVTWFLQIKITKYTGYQWRSLNLFRVFTNNSVGDLSTSVFVQLCTLSMYNTLIIAIVIEIKIKVTWYRNTGINERQRHERVTRYAKHIPDRMVLFRFALRITSTGGAGHSCAQNRLRLAFKRKEKVIRFGLKSQALHAGISHK